MLSDYLIKKSSYTLIIAKGLFFILIFIFSVSASTVLGDYKEENEIEIDIEKDKMQESIVKPLDIPVVNVAPAIDGNISDEFWSKAVKLTIGYEFFPRRLAKPFVGKGFARVNKPD